MTNMRYDKGKTGQPSRGEGDRRKDYILVVFLQMVEVSGSTQPDSNSHKCPTSPPQKKFKKTSMSDSYRLRFCTFMEFFLHMCNTSNDNCCRHYFERKKCICIRSFLKSRIIFVFGHQNTTFLGHFWSFSQKDPTKRFKNQPFWNKDTKTMTKNIELEVDLFSKPGTTWKAV